MTDSSQEPLQLSLGMGAVHNNRHLFSDHYLEKLLPQDARWAVTSTETEDFLAWIQDLYAGEREQLPHYKESQLEEHWFKSILTRLGHTFESQASVPGLEAKIKVPDFVFFADEQARQAAVAAQRTEEYTGKALAVGEVKAWDVPLGKKAKDGGPSFDKQNPSFQIDYYLKATGLEWGVLSNGRHWRLVHKDSSQRLNIYYEVDLIDLLQRGNPEEMRYFILFFRQSAFRAGPDGRIFLDDMLAASKAYALELEQDLHENVYMALERLMQGFLDLRRNQLSAQDLPQIYRNSLYLLYRLLFIFYAESRELLPVEENEEYREHYSLHDLKHEIARDNVPTKAGTAVNWGNLQTLFGIINGDDVETNRSLGVPRYNGGLFNPELHPFLAEKAVGDQALVDAIDLLARRTTAAGQEFVDYRTLGERQLGSIYEGLLEYQPRYAEEAMVAIRDKEGERWVPEAEAPKKARVMERRSAGQLYLATDRGERKATGSYYTPDYIVQYIVENTLGPLVEEATERARQRGKEARSNAEKERAAQSLVDEILNLKVLDPALGSGHFLVEVTEYLAVVLATDPYVQTETTPEEDITYWKRRVVERCIYGVDKNPLAVELAKLSLWLSTVAADQPLSFLDHHLKCGDSLIGARVDDLGWAPPVVLGKKAQKQLEQQKAGQMNLFEYRLSQQLPAVMGKVLEIVGQESDSYETVQAKEAADEAVRQLKTPFEAVANLWVSAYFGHEISLAEYGDAVDAIGTAGLQEIPAVQEAQEMARQRRFFHWELAFPEIFYDENGQPLRDAAGFDAVVGNPPYVRQELMSSVKSYLAQAQASVYSGNADLYVYFYYLGVELLRNGGRTSYIATNKWLKASYGQSLRAYFSRHAEIEQIIDFGHAPMFKDVDVFPTVILLRKSVAGWKPKDENKTEICLFPREMLGHVGLDEFIQRNSYLVPMQRFNSRPWSLERTEVEDLMAKLRGVGEPLSSYLGSDPVYGIKTGLNSAFLISTDTRNRLIDEDPSCIDVIVPYLRGQDIKRWSPEWSGLWMILLKSSENHAWPWSELGADEAETEFTRTFPAIHRHLLPFKAKLRKRADQGRCWWELRSCTYYTNFEQPKIVHTDITWRPQFAFTSEVLYLLNTAYMWQTDDLYLLAVVNSPLLWTYMWRNVPHGKDEALRLIRSSAETLPIVMPTEETRAKVENATRRLIDLTDQQRIITQELLAWLNAEFGVSTPGKKLRTFAESDETTFIQEVRQRGPQNARRFTPADVRILGETYAEHTTQFRVIANTVLKLEHQLSDLINAAYQLSAAEVDWLWRTAPPRMPIKSPEKIA